jgi:glycosyltransferase involved in cell wall biosynthesis
MLLKPAMRKSHWRKRLVLAMEMRQALAQARAVHCASDEEAEAVRHLAPAAHTRIIPFGVDVAQSTVTQPVNRPKIAGYLGRLTAIKNLETLVAAWADVRPAGWQLRIAGPDCDGTRARVQEMVRRLELNGIVSVDPPVAAQAVPKFLSSLAVFIQPSLSENFGMVVAEALAASTPVIATTGTPWHALADRGCGWCVAPSQAALAAAIRAATSASTDELAHMGRRGTDWIAAEYSWPVIAPRFLRELYEIA